MEKITMLDYIRETPAVVTDIIDHSFEYTRELVDFYRKHECEGICLIASGSSYNGCLIASHFIRHVLGIDLKLITPFSFVNDEYQYVQNEFFLGVSQSGCSTNILDALRLLRKDGHPVACLVGRDDCDARDIADLTVNWRAGEEKVGFVTKGVTSLACFLMCFALELGRQLGMIGEEKYDHAIKQLKKTQAIQPEMMNNTISLFEQQKDLFLNSSRVILLSNGPGLAICHEGALKIAETSCISAIPYEAEEFLHGPIYPSTPDDLFLLVDNDDSASTRLLEIADALKDISGRIFVVTNDEHIDADHRFSVSDKTCKYTSVLYKLTCLQTLSYLMTLSSNSFEPHECVKRFKKANKVASKSRDNLYLDLQKIG